MKKTHRSRKRRSPVNTGLLIDLYLRAKQLDVVMNNYLSRYSLTNKEKEELEELHIEILTTQITGGEMFQKFKLPRWGSLPEELKQVFKIAAVGADDDAVAVSCNLSTLVAMTAYDASRGEADYVGRKFRKIQKTLKAPDLIAAVLEDAGNRQGCNPGLHFHAAARIPAADLPLLKSELKRVFAAGYREIAGNQAVVIKKIHQSGLWASYCCKSLGKGKTGIEKPLFSTTAASQAGELLFQQVMHWHRQTPSASDSRSRLNGLIRPHIKCNPSPELVSLIAKHQEQQKAFKHLRRQQTRSYKELAINNPDSFRAELFDSLQSTAQALQDMQFKPHPERADEAFIADCIPYTQRDQNALITHYEALPWVGRWASSGEDEEPLFGHHPDPED